MQTWKKAKNVGIDQQISTETIHGMGHVTNERYLEVGVMGQQMNVENVVPSEIVEEEQMEACEDLGETF